ncbi:hypothetical protein SAMD00019534_016580, partial [Acytostelium subglobosum LB1]|uniref:hypothetical protein n=1 Tax=Acytostelium subglobosum LB1 TaxID=1410327 RepID=UPI00064509ED
YYIEAMFKYLLFAVVLSLVVVTYVSANAGLVKPIPRMKCSDNSAEGCRLKAPCKRRTSNMINAVYYHDAYQIAIFQKEAFKTESSNNTYTLQFFVDDAPLGIQLLTFNQNDMSLNKSMYTMTVPSLDTIQDLKDADLSWDDEGNVYGYLQLTFDTRSGNGHAYYSCADVRLQQKKVLNSAKSFTIEDVTTVSVANGGLNTTVESTNSTVVVPTLVQGAALPTGDVNTPSEPTETTTEIQEETKEGSFGSKVSSSSTFIFASIFTSAFLVFNVFSSVEKRM